MEVCRISRTRNHPWLLRLVCVPPAAITRGCRAFITTEWCAVLMSLSKPGGLTPETFSGSAPESCRIHPGGCRASGGTALASSDFWWGGTAGVVNQAAIVPDTASSQHQGHTPLSAAPKPRSPALSLTGSKAQQQHCPQHRSPGAQPSPSQAARHSNSTVRSTEAPEPSPLPHRQQGTATALSAAPKPQSPALSLTGSKAQQQHCPQHRSPGAQPSPSPAARHSNSTVRSTEAPEPSPLPHRQQGTATALSAAPKPRSPALSLTGSKAQQQHCPQHRSPGAQPSPSPAARHSSRSQQDRSKCMPRLVEDVSFKNRLVEVH
ncbi:flocculation protein FLO11-like isoform X2 [Oncorhynchus mykiss]|uniref:flocculation protein FLO11-like isoform X2 n=1 Tax=Oncorhynchus mykiss TaxID=8022 RepID=UPI001878D226|nr:flocculation protein FLO11-like isoform X2 [Oncorhynchus mykiss]